MEKQIMTGNLCNLYIIVTAKCYFWMLLVKCLPKFVFFEIGSYCDTMRWESCEKLYVCKSYCLGIYNSLLIC